MTARFGTRALIAGLIALIGFLLWLTRYPETIVSLVPIPGMAIEPTTGPTPPPPILTAPRGELPTGHAGFEAWVHYRDSERTRAGSGFLLQLPNGETAGVMTAHSIDWSRALQRIIFHLPQQSSSLIEFDTFYGMPGRAFTGYGFDVDYVLLRVDDVADGALVLEPDARGRPQPGERVVLFSGQGDGNRNPRALYGTVTTASETAVWAQMDDVFDPSNMSGSPLLSAHTGRVVGMAIAATRAAPIRIGFHPIGSLVEKATAATQFPHIADGIP